MTERERDVASGYDPAKKEAELKRALNRVEEMQQWFGNQAATLSIGATPLTRSLLVRTAKQLALVVETLDQAVRSTRYGPEELEKYYREND